MTNQEAIDLLDDFAETTARATRAATWAQAYLCEGGEATWDAVKGVSYLAATLESLSTRVMVLADDFEEILPE